MANLSNETIKLLEQDGFSVSGYGFYTNGKDIPLEDSDKISLAKIDENGEFIHIIIKAPKKELTYAMIQDKMNKDKTFVNFCNDFKKLLPEKYKNMMDIYPTSYGIGVFVALNFRNEKTIAINEIERILTEKNIIYKNQFSDAGYVYRFLISKSKENIERIN
jgi:hypothetical protein